MIRNLIARFERTGSVGDLSGRSPKRTVRIDAAMEAVRQNVLEDSSAFTRRRSAQLGIASEDSKTGFKNVSIKDPNGPSFTTPRYSADSAIRHLISTPSQK